MLQVNRLRLLCELHHRRTLAAVAQALSYSPSAVSQQLRQLEIEVGAKLIEPAGRGVRLTEQALILVSHGEQILRLLEQAKSEVEASLHEVRGAVRVAAFQTAALTLIPVAMSDIHERLPLVTIEFTQGEPDTTLPGLVSAEFDLVVVESYPGYPGPAAVGIVQDKLMDDPLWLVMSTTMADRLDPEVKPIGQLADVGWALEPAASVPSLWVTEQCQKSGFEPRVVCRSEDILVHRRLAETGQAVAVLPGLALSDPTPALTSFPIEAGLAHREIFVATRAATRNSPAINAVREALTRAAHMFAGRDWTEKSTPD
ncbi:LysR family transcriptional regulator [Rhodococcus sp. NPDC059968]|uniref:LysR family transcriptional regulator n=1 Tax=Rhodococcus sp. NPDC059968 TaxID=3347017 RepID=UPI00366D8BB5